MVGSLSRNVVRTSSDTSMFSLLLSRSSLDVMLGSNTCRPENNITMAYADIMEIYI